jgi:DNA-binding CsgD family transcriptional regulator
MQHLIIITGILAFGMGIVSLMAVHRYYTRYRLEFLKLYLGYLVVLNISVFLNLMLHYLLTNVFTAMAVGHKVLIIIVFNILGFYLLIILTYLYLLLTRKLIGKSLGKNVWRFGTGLVVFASLAYGFATAQWASSSDISFFILIHKIFVSLPTVVSLVASLILFANAGSLGTKSRIRSLKLFSVIYILFFAYQCFLWLFSIQVWIILSTFNLLVLNIIPIPFLGGFLKEDSEGVMSSPDTREKIEAFYRIHGLSKREKEIVDLIVAGKSNEQIEQELFISIFTVKKHISNIFMKMDINSRAQLIPMVYQAALAGHESVEKNDSSNSRESQ